MTCHINEHEIHALDQITAAMSLEFAILGFLREQPSSGYELKTRCFEGTAQSFWKADQAQIYRTLERLEREKLVSSRTTQQGKRPPKKVFRVTQNGNEALDEWLRTAHEQSAQRDPFALRVFFAGDLANDELQGLYLDEINDQKKRLEALDSELKTLDAVAIKSKKKTERDIAMKKFALEGIKMRILAEIKYKKSVLSELTNL